MEQGRGQGLEPGGILQIQLFRAPQVLNVLFGYPGAGDVVDVHFVFFDQEKEQIQGAFELVKFETAALGFEGCLHGGIIIAASRNRGKAPARPVRQVLVYGAGRFNRNNGVYSMDLFKNPVGSLPTKGWLQVSQKTMIFNKILVFCCFSTVAVQKLKFLNSSNS
jgi:hypothetical protein